jgi:7-cyano-7-deazaguanine synthase
MNARAKAVVLLSGGIDSTTATAIAKREGFDVFALSVRYGQRHTGEIDAATRVATALDVTRHVVLDLDLRAFGGSALTDDIPVPKDRSDAEIGTGIPVTYVPARNTVFLSLALAWAEALGAHAVFIGVNALDFSGYPDCRPAFIDAFQQVALLGTRVGAEGSVPIEIRTPLISLSKAEIIKRGMALGVDYALTVSCYDPAADGAACGHCDACQLRRKGFAEAGIPDLTRYAEERARA